MKLKRTILRLHLVLLICIFSTPAIGQETDDIKEYEIISTADLVKFESENEGDPKDGNEYSVDDNRKGVFNRMDKAVIVVYSLIIFVGLIANSVVFFVIFAGNEIGKTVTTIYILQLTIADSVFLLTLPIFSMQKLSSTWNFGSAICGLCQTIKFLNYYAGIFFLTAMSIDRYIAVAYSTRLTQIRTKERTYFICGLIWLLAVIMSIPLMMYARIEQSSDATYCRIMFPGYETLSERDTTITIDYVFGEDESNQTVAFYEYPSGDYGDRSYHYYDCGFDGQPHVYKVWLVVDFLVAFVVPFAVIVIMYAMILLHLKTVEHKIGHTATNRAARMRRRVTWMVAALVVCFTACWLPHHILMLIKIDGFASTVPICYGMEELFIALAFSNSALNPILYTFMGNNFRERFMKSVRNTQIVVKRRTSSRGSIFRRSFTHSGDGGHRRQSGAVLYRKSSNGSAKDAPGSNNKHKCNVTLLGFKKDPCNHSYDIDDSHRGEVFYPTTSLLDHTTQTKLDA